MKKIIALVLALVMHTTMASEVGYEVEVIIFEDVTGKYIDSEQWLDMFQKNPDEEYLQQLPLEPVEPVQPAKDPGYKIEFMPGENFLLKESVTRLMEHPEFKVHVHKVWKQPGLDRDMAVPFQINSLEQLLDPSQYLTEETTPAEPAALEDSSVTTPAYESYVDGTVTLIMSRYLHFNTNLVLHRNEEGTVHSYPIIGERRMKSRETHYLDHPLLGVIVIATPFKIIIDEDKPKPIGVYRTL